MDKNVILGVLIPFFGTTLGEGMVFFLKKRMGANIYKYIKLL